MNLKSCFSYTALTVAVALATRIGAQNVQVTLTPVNPPVQVPASGGNFDFTIAVANTGTGAQTFDVWCMLTLPNGSPYGPVLGPVNLTLPAGASLQRLRTQIIPAGAPLGTYSYIANVGTYPNTVWNSANFPFEKLVTGGGELWVTRYNGPWSGFDVPDALAVDTAGNFYVTGHGTGVGSLWDYTTIKYNTSGVQQWVAIYNGPANGGDNASAIAVDGAGNVYITGGSTGSGTGLDYATIKYNASGVQQWLARYNGPGNGDDYANALAVDGAGNVFVTGSSAGNGTSLDYATIRYNASGVQQWVARYNGPGNGSDIANAVIVDGTSNTIVIGESAGSGTSSDFATIKYNSLGVQQWVARYNGPGNGTDIARTVIQDGTSNTIVVGESVGSGTSSDFATVKYDSSGVLQWISRYNGPGNGADVARAVIQDGTSNTIIVGESAGSGTSADFATVKYNSSGVQQWVSRYNGPGNGNDLALDVAGDSTGNVYVAGGSVGNGTLSDFATVKYNSSGVLQWVSRYNGPGNDFDAANAMVVDGSGNVCVTGGSAGSGTLMDYATIKYSGGNLANWEPIEPLVFGSQEPVAEYKLNPCYPNPFNATTAIRYQIPDARQVSLRVYDSAGRLVTTLVNGWREAGSHEVTWDAGGFASGLYFCRIQAGDFQQVTKMMLVK